MNNGTGPNQQRNIQYGVNQPPISNMPNAGMPQPNTQFRQNPQGQPHQMMSPNQPLQPNMPRPMGPNGARAPQGHPNIPRPMGPNSTGAPQGQPNMPRPMGPNGAGAPQGHPNIPRPMGPNNAGTPQGQPNIPRQINPNRTPEQQEGTDANKISTLPNNNNINQQNISSGQISIPNVPDIQPQTATPVQPIQQAVPQDIVIDNSNDNQQISAQVTPSIIEDAVKDQKNEPAVTNVNSDVADITFDYNSIYGIPQDQNVIKEQEKQERPVFTAQEIVIENRDLEGRAADDVVPEFNINSLDANTTESDSRLTDNVLNDRQQDRADTRRKILFIAVLVALLIISVGFIFPIISGNPF